jgi:hypothetical protein
MPGLVPGIHVFSFPVRVSKTWMAGSSPAMTGRAFLFANPASAHSSFTIPN